MKKSLAVAFLVASIVAAAAANASAPTGPEAKAALAHCHYLYDEIYRYEVENYPKRDDGTRLRTEVAESSISLSQ